jgi:hypothetical protein
VKLIVQLRRNAYAIEWSFARVHLRDVRDEDSDDIEENDDDEELDEAQMRVDPAGSVYCQAERLSAHERPSDWTIPIEARKFGFQRGS